jgi:probable HAF family extracellular repeat protein
MNNRIVGLMTICLMTGSIAANAQTYTVTELGALGPGYSIQAAAINNSGQVAGTSTFFTPETIIPQATIWNGTTATQLGNLPGSNGNGNAAFGINNAGSVVGYASDDSGNEIPTVWNGTTPTALNTLGGVINHAVGINDAGKIVGFMGADIPTAWNGSHPTILPGLAGLGGSDFNAATAINNRGQIVGYSEPNPETGEHAVLWQSSSSPVHDLGTLGGNFSDAYGINNSGEIVGISSKVGGGASYGFMYENGKMTALPGLGLASPTGPISWANGIDSAGLIVGFSTASGHQEATIWNGTTAINLNTLLGSKLAAGVTLIDAVAISSNGRIVADGSDGGVYVLTPNRVPEIDSSTAASALSLLLGCIAVLRGRRRLKS